MSKTQRSKATTSNRESAVQYGVPAFVPVLEVIFLVVVSVVGFVFMVNALTTFVSYLGSFDPISLINALAGFGSMITP